MKYGEARGRVYLDNVTPFLFEWLRNLVNGSTTSPQSFCNNFVRHDVPCFYSVGYRIFLSRPALEGPQCKRLVAQI